MALIGHRVAKLKSSQVYSNGGNVYLCRETVSTFPYSINLNDVWRQLVCSRTGMTFQYRQDAIQRVLEEGWSVYKLLVHTLRKVFRHLIVRLPQCDM